MFLHFLVFLKNSSLSNFGPKHIREVCRPRLHVPDSLSFFMFFSHCTCVLPSSFSFYSFFSMSFYQSLNQTKPKPKPEPKHTKQAPPTLQPPQTPHSARSRSRSLPSNSRSPGCSSPPSPSHQSQRRSPGKRHGGSAPLE